MKINSGQLDYHLRNDLKSLYLVLGDDILLAQETCDLIRAAGRVREYTERVVITVEANNNWEEQLYNAMHSLSLFANKRLIELQTNGGKINAATGKALAELFKEPSPHILLLVRAKIDANQQQSAWFKTFDKEGVIIQIWPIPPEQLPLWIIQRGKSLNLTIMPNAAAFLASQVEGNLLAAAQEIEKLALLNSTTAIMMEDIEQVSNDNAKFDIFIMVDCILSGNINRSLRILKSLAAENIDPILILWAICRELRSLAGMLEAHAKGEKLGAILNKFHVWEKRKAYVGAFLQRTTLSHCLKLLTDAARIDRMIKGAETGNVFISLERLICAMCFLDARDKKQETSINIP